MTRSSSGERRRSGGRRRVAETYAAFKSFLLFSNSSACCSIVDRKCLSASASFCLKSLAASVNSLSYFAVASAAEAAASLFSCCSFSAASLRSAHSDAAASAACCCKSFTSFKCSNCISCRQGRPIQLSSRPFSGDLCKSHFVWDSLGTQRATCLHCSRASSFSRANSSSLSRRRRSKCPLSTVP